MLARLRSFLRAALRRSRLERELDEELRFHLLSRAEDLIRQGLSRAEAERRARIEMGFVETHKEDYRAARGLRLVDELRQDALYALRTFRRNPGFTAVAIVTLALGIGANTLFFTVVESVLLRPLPYHEPDRLVMVYSTGSFGPFKWSDGPFVDPDILELQRLTAFSHLASFSSPEVTLTGAGEPRRVASAAVTASLFDLLGVQPALGRTFAGDERAVVVLSAELWRSQFGADARAIGQSIKIEGEPHTIVGVMGGELNFPTQARLWTPLQLRPGYRGNAMNRSIGRLAEGVTQEQAQAQVETLFANLGKQLPPERRAQGPGVRVVELREAIVGNVRGLLLVLLGAVSCVLLIGCANMANLLMARAASRGPEMFLRASLGAGRARLVRQLLTESTALAGLGGGLGLLLVFVGLPALLAFVPASMLPRIEEVHVNGSVLLFTLGVSVLTGLLFGLAPALFCLRGAGAAPQRPGSSRARAERRVHGALIVAETSLVLVLLVGAGLLLRSFWRLQHVDPGFRREGLLTMSVWLPERIYRTPDEKRAFHLRLLERLQGLPELGETSAINLLPFGSAGWQGDFRVEGREEKPAALIVGKPAVSEGYFRALGIPLTRGRVFEARDTDGVPRVAIVSESVARFCWPGEDPLGKRLSFDDREPRTWRTVVGVVGDVRQESLAKPLPMIYAPLRQESSGFFLTPMAFVARPPGDLRMAAAALRGQLRALDPELPPQRIELLDRLLSDSLAQPRLRTGLLLAFALLALLLALVGIHGVMAYEVARRTTEIGIRRALGAETRDVLRLVLGRITRLVSAGLALGLLGAAAATRTLEAFLFAVRPLDAVTFLAVPLALLSTALLAGTLPARRAARVDPAVALRYE